MLFCKDLSSHMFLNLLRYNFVGTKIWLIKMINNDTKELNLKLINIFAYVSLVISAACILLVTQTKFFQFPDSILSTATLILAVKFVLLSSLFIFMFRFFQRKKSKGEKDAFWTVMLILGLLLFIVSLLFFVFDKYAYIGPGVLRFSGFGSFSFVFISSLLFCAQFLFFQVIERIYRLEANHFLRKAMNIVIALMAVTCLLIVLVNITIGTSTKNEIKNWENARYHHATVVFGAGVYQSGEISGVFMDRLKTASRLFHSGKTDLIIVSTSLDQPNEQELILSTLRSLEVPDGMIIIDSKGSRTLETCKNVFQEYNLSDINVVSQAYHLPRIIFTCRHTGVISIDGIIADNSSYSIQNQIIWYLREKVATMIAFVELIIFHESNSS